MYWELGIWGKAQLKLRLGDLKNFVIFADN